MSRTLGERELLIEELVAVKDAIMYLRRLEKRLKSRYHTMLAIEGVKPIE